MAEKAVKKREKKLKGKTDLVENVGKVMVNLGQMVFGTLFLGGVCGASFRNVTFGYALGSSALYYDSIGYH